MTTSTILAAKLEQPMTPSIKRMIKLLYQEEEALVDKDSVIFLEEQMLTILQFEFNHPSSLTFMERFMRLSIGLLSQKPKPSEYLRDESTVAKLHELSFDLLLLATQKICFLNYKPSILGAAALIFTISHFEQKNHASMTRYGKINKTSLVGGSNPGFLDFGLTMWSEHMPSLTDISIEDIMEPLLKLTEEALSSETFKAKHMAKP